MIHDGHRERLRKKVEMGATEPHEKVEMMLFLSRPRVDTNGIAHELLARFGGIHGLFHKDVDTLMGVNGVGQTTALHIRNVAQIIREYNISECHTAELLKSDIELFKYLRALFTGACNELTYMLMFSKKDKFIGYKKIGEGSYSENTVIIRPALVFAKKNGAKKVIIAHNHPDGIAIASDDDIETARKMNVAFGNFDITILDHFVVADGRCVRFTDNNKNRRRV